MFGTNYEASFDITEPCERPGLNIRHNISLYLKRDISMTIYTFVVGWKHFYLDVNAYLSTNLFSGKTVFPSKWETLIIYQ